MTSLKSFAGSQAKYELSDEYKKLFNIVGLEKCHKKVFGSDYLSPYNSKNFPYSPEDALPEPFIRLFEFCIFSGRFKIARILFNKQAKTIGCGVATGITRTVIVVIIQCKLFL